MRENAIVHSAGSGVQRDEMRALIRPPHFAGVGIGHRVEIGMFTAARAATIDRTVIRDDVKIDNVVQIAHDCHVGSVTIISACVEVSGSVRLGEQCWVGLKTCVIEGRRIGNGITIGIGAVVIKDVHDHQVVGGNPAEPTEDVIESQASLVTTARGGCGQPY